MKTPQELAAEGFTQSGATRYNAATKDYCDQLFAKSIALGENDKAPGSPREVTHDHVRSAAAAMSLRSNNKPRPLSIICQIGEYVCAAVAGIGSGKLDTPPGILMFVLSVALGVIFFVTRNVGSKE